MFAANLKKNMFFLIRYFCFISCTFLLLLSIVLVFLYFYFYINIHIIEIVHFREYETKIYEQKNLEYDIIEI